MSELDQRMFAANFVGNVKRGDSWEYLPILDAALGENKTRPLKPWEWQSVLTTMQVAKQNAEKDSKRSDLPKSLRYIEKLQDAADNIPGMARYTDYLKEKLKNWSVVKDINSKEVLEEAYKRGSVYSNYSEKAAEIASEFHKAAKQSPELVALFNTILGRELGKVDASADEIVLENPELRPLLDELRSPKRNEELLRDLKGRVIDSLTTELNRGTADLTVKIDRQSATLERMAAQELEAREAHNEEIRRVTVESGISGAIAIYSLLGGDKYTVQRLSGVLNAATSARQAIKTFKIAMEAGSSTAMAGLALAGGWVSITLALASAFATDDTPSFEEQMQEALQQISKQLQEIQKQIAAAVNHIDTRISQLSEQIDDGFRAIFNGLAQNQYRLDTLLQTSYSISRTLSNTGQAILSRLDYEREFESRKLIEQMREFVTLNRAPLPDEDFRKAILEIDTLIDQGRDFVVSGPSFATLAEASAWVRSEGDFDDVYNWERNINSYRSLAGLLGLQIDRGIRLCEPSRWRYAVSSYVDICINAREDYLPKDDVLSKRLVDEGQRYIDEVSALAAWIPGKPDSLDVLIKFLMDEYDAAAESLGNAVSEIHAAKLSANKSTLRVLPEFSVLEEMFSTPNSFRSGYREVVPVKTGEQVLLEPRSIDNGPPEAVEKNGWKEDPRLKYLVPSWRLPEGSWPTLNAIVLPVLIDSWLIAGFDLQSAFMAEALGLVELTCEYQVQIDNLATTKKFNLIFGAPAAHWFLFAKGAFGRKWVAASRDSIVGIAPQFVICYDQFSRFGPLGLQTGPLEMFIAATSNLRLPQATPEYLDQMAPGTSWDTSRDEVLERFQTLALAIREELLSQLNAPDSPVGQAARRLTRIVSLARGVCSWIAPNVLDDANVRFALFGRSDFTIDDSVSSVLLTLDGLLDVVAARRDDTGEIISPEVWTNNRLLQNVGVYGKLSAFGFAESLKRARTHRIEREPYVATQDVMYLFTLFRRYYTMTT